MACILVVTAVVLASLCMREDLGKGGGEGRERFDESFPACPPPFFFLDRDQLAGTEFHPLGQDQSTETQRAEMTMDECSLASCA